MSLNLTHPKISKYSTGQKSHFDLCYSFDVFAPPNEESKVASHFGWEFDFLDSGAFFSPQKMKLRGKTNLISRDGVLIYNALESHEEIYSDQASNIKSLVVPNQVIDQIIASLDIKSSEIVFEDVENRHDRKLRVLVETVYSFRDLKEARVYSFESSLTSLLVHLLSSVKHSHSSRVLRSSGTGHYPRSLEQMKMRLRENIFEEKYGLDELSKDVGLSKFHLVRVFNRSVGISPIQYKNILRVDEVKKLLLNSQIAVSEIARKAGYSDLSTFNKSFKRLTSLSPSEFRQK